MYDIFLSHSSADKEAFVEPLVKELEIRGLQIWYDKNNINRGDRIRESILSGISESVLFVAVISEHYYASSWANLELGILQANKPESLLPIVFSSVKDFTGQKYPFLLEHNYISGDMPITQIADELFRCITDRKQEYGIWHLEKTNLKQLVKEMRGYNCFKLEQIAIRLNKIAKTLTADPISALNEIRLLLELIFVDIAETEGGYIDTTRPVIDSFICSSTISDNLREHLNYLNSKYNLQIRNYHGSQQLDKDDIYLIQFSLYSIIEWYMISFFTKPVVKQKKIVPVMPEEFQYSDIIESYEIERLVLPPALIASQATDLEWFKYNPLTNIGARDLETGKLVGFFTTLPVSDSLYESIQSGNFDDTLIGVKDIKQYDMPGFYKLYLCSFCIHPDYNTTSAFKTIYTAFIDFLIYLAEDREIFISDIIADGVTPQGASLCESVGMKKVTGTIHDSHVYEAALIPPAFTTLKLNNRIGKKLIAYYQHVFEDYKEMFT